MQCPGSIVLGKDAPSTTTRYAAEGTAAHSLLTLCMKNKAPAADYVGDVIAADGFTFEVDEEMARHVQTAIDYVKDAAGSDGVIVVDERVNYSMHLGVPVADAFGTLDVMIMRGDELIVIDFKYGKGVKVAAENNPQGLSYALLALTDRGQFSTGVIDDATVNRA